MTGLQASLLSLEDPLVGGGRAKFMAEVRAAIVAQRQLSSKFDEAKYAATSSLYTHVTEHNLQQPWENVLQVHSDMLVRLSNCCCANTSNVALVPLYHSAGIKTRGQELCRVDIMGRHFL